MQSVQSLVSLQNKRIIVGICGGIAAYKVPELVRRLKDAGALVKVVMTDGAMEFITPLTLQAVSGERVHTALLDADAEAGMGHIELARWGDAIVVAPATADALARFASGRADDLLGTLLRASDGQVLLAPAMNQAMWRDVATQQNLQSVIEQGYKVVGPESGSQACGDVGLGRMSEPQAIAESAAALFETMALSGKHVVITAGPTREPIDPVRYVSNHSSGKMGFALAAAAVEAGARVTLVAGPVNEPTPERVERIDVETAEEMLAAVTESVQGADVFIASAAVADFRVECVSEEKLKKKEGEDRMTLSLVKNPDILASVAARTDAPFTVGFAAETERVIEYATAKLQKKQLDMLVANDVSRADIGFSSDDNEVSVLLRDEDDEIAVQALSKNRKSLLSRQIISILATRLNDR